MAKTDKEKLKEKEEELKEKDKELKDKDKVIKALRLKTRPKSLGFYRSRFR